MANTCSICGNKIKALEPTFRTSDGKIDQQCALKAGIKGGAGIDYCHFHTVQDIRDIIESGSPITDIKAELKKEKEQQKAKANQEKAEQKKRAKHVKAKQKEITNEARSKQKKMLNEAKVKQKETTEKKLAIIQDQFKAAGVSNLFGTKKEVVALPGILADNEVVKYATSGTVNGNTVLMLCTDMRVLFIDKGLMYGIRFTEIPLDMVNSVNYQKGLILGSISIVNGAVITQINSVTKETAPIMADAIKKARNEFIKPQQTVTQATPQKSTADELREFKSLMDDGILTQEEFTLKKKQLLGL